MSFDALLTTLVLALEAQEIPFMLTGSLASSYHGVPRATQDIDFVVDASLDRFLALSAALRDQGFYVSDDAIREAVTMRGMFNAVDPDTGWKVDFIVRKDRPFSLAEFADRQTTEFAGVRVGIARAEDVIVAKLEWSRFGGSGRQLRDVAGILAAQGVTLDYGRIENWVESLGLETEWEEARQTSP